jgi:ABC-type lipoprotein release transport system permease subunit
MSLWKIAWRSIQQRSLASGLTSLSMALGVTLVVAVLVVRGMINSSFLGANGLGYNLIVGAKGSKVQLVLNTVYYLSSPVENVPYSFYKEFTEGKYKPYTELAVPVCMGDVYENFRVIGTTPEMFDKLEYGQEQKYEFSVGRNFHSDDFFSAVVGARVARETGLTVGSEFHPTHGVGGHKHDPFKVVGVLSETGTPVDRGLFVNIEGFYLLANHARPAGSLLSHPPAGASEKADHDHMAGEHDDHEHSDHDHADHDHADHAHDGKAGPAPADDHDHAHEPGHEHAKDHDHEAAAMPDHGKHEHEAASGSAVVDHDATPDPAHPPVKEPPGHEHADEAREHADHDHDAHEHHEHDEHGHSHSHAPLPESQREVTAILVLTASIAGAPPELQALGLVKAINKESIGQAVSPIGEISSLFSIFIGPIETILLALTVLIVAVSGISILVSIYNSMSERRREIAVMRALGAGRGTVMLIVLVESILLSLMGGLAGWALGHLLVGGLSPWISQQSGVEIGFFRFEAWELVIIPGLIVLASIAGYLPAVVAYRTDVSRVLSAAP